MTTQSVHNLAKEIDEGFELKAKLKELTARSDEIKKKLRASAELENPDKKSSGESIVLKGNQHKAKINLSEDSFSLGEEAATTDILRMKAVVGQGIIDLKEGVSFKEGITLRKVKEALGEKYSELFEDDCKVKIKAEDMTRWFAERRKVANSDDAISFVEKTLTRKPNTSRVTFSK
jgi:hypothetical protein